MPISMTALMGTAAERAQALGGVLSNDPAQLLAQLSEREQQRYNTDYAPVEDRAIASLNDTSMIRDARANADAGFRMAPARMQREMGRYGMQQSAVDRQESDMGFSMGRSLTKANNVNNARLDQFDRNKGMRSELINFGRGVAGDVYSGLGDATALKESRDAANRQASANNKAQRWQIAGGLGAAAIALI
jgi:hypothetical protein